MAEAAAAAAAVAEEEKKKWKAVEAEKAKKVGGSKTAGKWRAVEESNSDDVEMVDEALSKCKRGKINTTVKYGDRNSCERCKHLNIECVAK